MKKCPYCAEEIQNEAIKCKHCGSDLIEQKNHTVIQNKSEYAKYLIIAILLPIVGIILGIILIAKSNQQDKKMGETILAWSILFVIIWGVALYLLMPNLYIPLGSIYTF